MCARPIAGSASAARWSARQAAGLSPEALDTALDYIRARPEIWEVILTGGDPLVLSPRRLRACCARLPRSIMSRSSAYTRRRRSSSPTRITPELGARAARHDGKATYVVLHANHPRELTPAARAACARFVDAGIPMLSQSVLLRGRQR